MSLALAGVRAALTPKWVSDNLWKRAGQVPAFHLDFTTGQVIERISGRLGTFTRPSSVKRAWNGSQFVEFAADVPALQRDPVTGLWGYLHEPAATNQHLDNAVLNLSNCTGASGGAGVVPGQAKTIVTGNEGILSKRVNSVGSAGAVTGTYCYWAIIESSSTEPNVFMVLTDNAGNTFRQRFLTASGQVNGASVTSGTVTGGAAVMRQLTSSIFLVGISATFTSPPQVLGQMWLDAFGASSTTKTVVVHHCQLETGPVATSPIVTTGSAVTRNADVWAWTGAQFSDWYNQAGGVFVWRGIPLAQPSFPGFAAWSDGTNANRIQLGGQDALFRYSVITASLVQAAITSVGSFVLGQRSRMAARCLQNDAAVSANGSGLGTDTSVTLPTLNTLRIGSDSAGGSVTSQLIQDVLYFPPGPAADRIQQLSAL
jgi:hypothetical protein